MARTVSAALEPSSRASSLVAVAGRAWLVVRGRWALLVLPAAWGVLGWRQRWVADDGLIVARTVREILAGYGPVFNPGEQVGDPNGRPGHASGSPRRG